MSKRFRLLLSGAFALLAFLGCLAYGDAVRSETEAAREEAIQRYGGEVTTIVVAAENLEVGDAVSASNCEERDWVADLVPEGALTSLEETLGTTLSSPVSKGTPLTRVAVRDSSETLEIPAGMAAYTIAVNERTGILSSVPLGTTLMAYRIADDGTQLLSADVMVIGRDPDGASKITVAVPYEDVSALIQSATDRSLRLVQPSGVEEGLDDTVPVDGYPESDDLEGGAEAVEGVEGVPGDSGIGEMAGDGAIEGTEDGEGDVSGEWETQEGDGVLPAEEEGAGESW